MGPQRLLSSWAGLARRRAPAALPAFRSAAVLLGGLAVGMSLAQLAEQGSHALRPAPTGALGALRWRQQVDRDEQGRIPRGALLRALAARRRLPEHGRTSKRAGLEGGWRSRGPNNVGGRSRALLIDPRNPMRLIAGSVSGGVFLSEDGGRSWWPVNDFLPNLAASSLAMDPYDPDTFYVGTGEGFYNADAVRGAGIFKTTDGGASFDQLAATAGWSAVNRIALSPAQPGLVLAATAHGIRRSTDGGHSWTATTTARALQVVFHPLAPERVLATEENPWAEHRVLYSHDGGQSWAPAEGIGGFSDWLARIEVAFAPSDPSLAYANQNGRFYRSFDGGASWQQVGSSGDGNWYFNAVWVSPVNPQLVLVGGFRVARSLDGGRSFKPISAGYILTQQVHPDVHGFVADPGFDGRGNQRLYVVCDGGVFVTDNLAKVSTRKGWRSLNAGFVTSQYYSGAGDGPSGLLVGGTQDNGTLRLQGSAAATLTYGGDGGDVEVDGTAPSYVYGEYVSLSDVFRSRDGGKRIERIDARLPERGQGNWIAPLALDPGNGNRLYAGAWRLWRTVNARTGKPPSWSEVKPEIEGVRQKISAIAVSPADSNLVFVAYNDGRVAVTRDALSAVPSWETLDDNAGRDPLPRRFPTRIVASWADPETAWISFGGFSTPNIWRTRNGGRSWEAASGGSPGLPAAPVRGLAQHPQRPEWLYAGTEVGVFASEDGGSSWAAVHQGPATVSVDDLQFLHRSTTLLAATHGRGMWTIDLP